MKKRKSIKPVGVKRKHLFAKWEIITATKYVDDNFPSGTVNDKCLLKIYQGNAVACILDGVIDSKQCWGVTILTTVKDDAGKTYTHEMTWRIPEPMTFNDFIKGNPDIKVNLGDGLRVRWSGVAQQWLKTVDEDLPGLTAVSAWATANCLAEIKTNNVKPALLNQYFGLLNAKDHVESIYAGVAQ